MSYRRSHQFVATGDYSDFVFVGLDGKDNLGWELSVLQAIGFGRPLELLLFFR